MKLNNDFCIRYKNENILLINTKKTTEVFLINETVKFIYNQFENDKTLEEIVNNYMIEYNIDKETAMIDIKETISNFLDLGVLISEK